MAEEGYFLTKESGNALLQMVQDYRKSPRGQASYGVPGDMDGYPPDDIFAPECYILEIPSGGIPARSGTVPGNALCNVYKIDLTADGEDEPLVDADFQVKAHNLTLGEISGGTGELQKFQLGWRDKFGRWFTIPIGSKRYGFTGSGGISAATLSGGELTPGSATVDEWRWNGTKYTDSGDDVVVYNPFPDTIAGNRIIAYSLDQDGLLTIDAEACNAFGETGTGS